jgi:hypothetical protein
MNTESWTARRQFLKFLAGLGSFTYARDLLGQSSLVRSSLTTAERLVIVYHPDGAFLEQWHPKALSGPITEWPESIQPLRAVQDQLILLRNLSLLDGTGDGHEEASRALLTGSKNPEQGSLDIHLADAFQQPLLHVGVLASKSQGQSVSFLPGGAEKPADDSPLAVYQRLFAGGNSLRDDLDRDVLKSVEKDLVAYTQGLEQARERIKLEQHLKQLRLLLTTDATCGGYDLSQYPYDDTKKWEDKAAPLILQMQIRNLVEAMSCGLSRVATLQLSRHTSPLKMDFDFLARWNNQYPMESHQASHNSGEIQAQQKKWINQQLLTLFQGLKSRPEPNPQRAGSMLDHTLVVVVSEISQGASHGRKDMPFYIVGGAGIPSYRPGRILDAEGASHVQLLARLAQLMGQSPKGTYAGQGVLTSL